MEQLIKIKVYRVSIFRNTNSTNTTIIKTKSKKNSYLVLDGKQRLLTIKEFIDGKLPNGYNFKLKKLRVLHDLEGKSWKDIKKDAKWENALNNETIRAAVIRGWQDERVLYEIFYRLNSGSVRLSPMELRMSLHPGEFLKFIIQWTESSRALHKILGKVQSDPRMGDVELSIRFLGYNFYKGQYNGDLKDFLDRVCISFNENFNEIKFKNEIISSLDTMEKAIATGLAVFGEKIFCRKFSNNDYESRFNRAIFDVQVGSLSNPKVRDYALNHKAEFKTAFEAVSEDNDFIRAVETTTKSVNATKLRFERWYNAVSKLTGVDLSIPDIQHEVPN